MLYKECSCRRHRIQTCPKAPSTLPVPPKSQTQTIKRAPRNWTSWASTRYASSKSYKHKGSSTQKKKIMMRSSSWGSPPTETFVEIPSFAAKTQSSISQSWLPHCPSSLTILLSKQARTRPWGGDMLKANVKITDFVSNTLRTERTLTSPLTSGLTKLRMAWALWEPRIVLTIRRPCTRWRSTPSERCSIRRRSRRPTRRARSFRARESPQVKNDGPDSWGRTLLPLRWCTTATSGSWRISGSTMLPNAGMCRRSVSGLMTILERIWV